MGGMMMGSLLVTVLGWLFTLVLIGVVIWSGLWLVRRAGGIHQLWPAVNASSETPLAILQRRLAQGEIDLEQFTQMKERLNQL